MMKSESHGILDAGVTIAPTLMKTVLTTIVTILTLATLHAGMPKAQPDPETAAEIEHWRADQDCKFNNASLLLKLRNRDREIEFINERLRRLEAELKQLKRTIGLRVAAYDE